MNIENIKNGLITKYFGQNIVFFERTDSTNIQAKVLAKEGASEGTVVIAEEQGEGRGRLERSFFSPKGMGLWFSVILRPKFNITDAPKCTLFAAVSVALAMEELNISPEIKWPNDIINNGKKLSGILTELTANADGSYFVVIGIGINVNFLRSDFPENIRDIASSLRIIKGEKIEREKFLQRVLFYMEEIYDTIEDEGFGKILNLWRKFSVTLNKNIRVINAGDNGEITGRALDIADDGALLIETGGVIKKILAGDVSIREMGNKS